MVAAGRAKPGKPPPHAEAPVRVLRPASSKFNPSMTDNGGTLPHAQNNDPWRGGKQDHYDGGLRVPFMVRWPGHIAAGWPCG